MGDLLKSLALDKWYKLVLYLGAGLIYLALTQDTKALTNKQVLLAGAALLSLGLAEWICDVRYSFIKPPNFYTGPTALISYYERTGSPGSLSLHC